MVKYVRLEVALNFVVNKVDFLFGEKYTYHWSEHRLIVSLERVLASIMARHTQVELPKLDCNFGFVHGTKFLLEFFGQKKVVSSFQIDVGVWEMVKQHHLDEKLSNVCSAVLQIHPRFFDTHAIFNAAYRCLLRTNIDDASHRVSSTETGRETLLHETCALEAEFSHHHI